MPRKYIRKTDREIDENVMKNALKEIFKNKVPVRTAARLYNLNRNTLVSRVRLIKTKRQERHYENSSDSGMSEDGNSRVFKNKYTVNQVFSISEEEELVTYVKKCSDLHYGLSYWQIRLLAFEFASQIPECKMPESWKTNKIAGLEWIYGFMSRHKELSLRKPESTSIMRATGFNKNRVNEFFGNYLSVLEKFKFKGERIYNLDETGVATVLKTINVVATKGKKQVGQVSSGERGENVTFVGIINAAGNTIPPVYIVARVRTPGEYIQGAPESSLVLGNKTAWMTKELFLRVLGHIKTHTNSSIENPILLLVDNHKSHVSLEAVKFCKESGITLLSFPPHTTHRMQPLDIGIYGPFKSALATIYDDWLISNPGKIITIRNLGEFTNKAFNRAFTRQNIINSFKKPGIWPVNRLAFSDEDFVASTVTDQPRKQAHNSNDNTNHSATLKTKGHLNHEAENVQPSTSTAKSPAPQVSQNEDTASQSVFIENSRIHHVPQAENSKTDDAKKRKISLIDIRPYPKTKERKVSKGRKRESKSVVYTSTPVLTELMDMAKTEKEQQRTKSLKISKTTKRKVFEEKEDEFSESESGSLELVDTDDDSSVDEFPLSLEQDFIVSQGDFVITKFPTKSTIRYYIGQVHQRTENDYEIKFLRRKNNSNTFTFPLVDDITSIERSDIVQKLPKPQTQDTARSSSLLKFKLNFRGWNIS